MTMWPFSNAKSGDDEEDDEPEPETETVEVEKELSTRALLRDYKLRWQDGSDDEIIRGADHEHWNGGVWFHTVKTYVWSDRLKTRSKQYRFVSNEALRDFEILDEYAETFTEMATVEEERVIGDE